jgi:hypothetical protein
MSHDPTVGFQAGGDKETDGSLQGIASASSSGLRCRLRAVLQSRAVSPPLADACLFKEPSSSFFVAVVASGENKHARENGMTNGAEEGKSISKERDRTYLCIKL